MKSLASKKSSELLDILEESKALCAPVRLEVWYIKGDETQIDYDPENRLLFSISAASTTITKLEVREHHSKPYATAIKQEMLACLEEMRRFVVDLIDAEKRTVESLKTDDSE